ncbi:MAG TPA: methionine synthase [Methanobacterium sp.]|nr:methionine synthase [Methanobacterium sp.]
MLTTVVGSYPVITGKPESFTEKIKASMGSYDPFKSALEYAVKDQILAGIDLISDGQVRGSMLEIFAQAIPGMDLEGNKPVIRGKITSTPYSIGGGDIKYALKIAGKISPKFKDKKDLFSNQKFTKDFKGVKGIITGPTTLALSSLVEGFYNKDKREEIIVDLAWALKKEAEYLENAGAALIQVDEPFLSTGMADLKIARKAVEIISHNLSIPVAMHVCGGVSDIWDELLKFKVNILDCEFAGQPKNERILESTTLKGKKLGLGCIDSKTDGIESREQVAQILKNGMDNLGEENIIADPDCGMRLRSREAAFSKLKVMVETVKWLS